MESVHCISDSAIENGGQEYLTLEMQVVDADSVIEQPESSRFERVIFILSVSKSWTRLVPHALTFRSPNFLEPLEGSVFGTFN